jgi:hypothetical protein
VDENQIVFENNKYTKWYFNIVQNPSNSSRYVEKHHIIPRCIGGTDHRENIVSLTAREHFVCHLLLTKMTTGKVKQAMCWAVGKFAQSSKKQNRKFTSWEYQKIRENISLARKGTKHSEETRKKMSEKRKGKAPWNKGIKQGPHSAESNKARSATMKDKPKSTQTKLKISEGKKGHKAGMTGKKHTKETLEKMRESALKRYAKTIS